MLKIKQNDRGEMIQNSFLHKIRLLCFSRLCISSHRKTEESVLRGETNNEYVLMPVYKELRERVQCILKILLHSVTLIP